MIKISIVTVARNAVECIERTILSVISQQYENLQYIIIDGNSNDGTQHIIEKYVDRIDIFVSENDSGIYDAMNKSLLYVRGDYVIFMNAGDTFYNPSTLSEVVKYMRKRGLYYGNALFFSSSQKWVYRKKANMLSLTRKNICHQTIFYPVDFFRMGNKYDLRYSILADWALNLKAYHLFPFYHVDRIVCCFDTSGISFSSKRDSTFLKEFPLLLKQNLGYIAYGYYEFRQLLKKILSLK